MVKAIELNWFTERVLFFIWIHHYYDVKKCIEAASEFDDNATRGYGASHIAQ